MKAYIAGVSMAFLFIGVLMFVLPWLMGGMLFYLDWAASVIKSFR